jgi:predicted phage baseplate assembly protein
MDEGGGWRHWDRVEHITAAAPGRQCFAVLKEQADKKTILVFSNGDSGAVPPKGENNIRLVAYAPEFAGNRLIGRSNGLPGQIFRLYEYPVDRESFIIQVGGKLSNSGEFIWNDWHQVNDFDLSGPGDRHYVLNPATGEVLFGNNEHGSIPPVCAEDNICIISCRTGGGDGGNVQANEINSIVGMTELAESIKVSNHAPARGGAANETIMEAGGRVRRELKKQYRAVTCADYEEIALATPGLRLSRVKAIPLFTPGLKDYPENKSPAQITVVVVPYSEYKKPMPGRGFLETVRRHLDNYRMITTEVLVIPPEYVQITVHAVVVTALRIRVDPVKIVEALEQFLDPLDEKDGSKGWPFGRTVYKGDIYGVINRIEGVEYIKELWMDAEGAGVVKELSGDIKIPPHGLVYSGKHEVETVCREDL